MVFVSLDTTKVKAGTTVGGVATIDNRTNTAISLPGDGCGNAWLNVGLENPKISYQPVTATSVCTRALALPVTFDRPWRREYTTGTSAITQLASAPLITISSGHPKRRSCTEGMFCT